jgi:xanthine dehydrogenase molybdenum-binding subunit
MQSKALLEKTPEPSDDDIAKALQMHVCRCTGWKKIHDSVHLAARWIREGKVSAQPTQGALGSS